MSSLLIGALIGHGDEWNVQIVLILGFFANVSGCAERSNRPSSQAETPSGDLVFLTRDGCSSTDTMRERLDASLRAVGQAVSYRVIDADTLPNSDPRRGYGTPTILVGNRDLFDMPEPPRSQSPAT